MTLTLIVITLVSLSLATAMSIIAGRAVRNERRRSEARIAALAAELGEISPEMSLPLRHEAPAVLQGSMFSTEEQTDAHSRTPLAIAAGGLIVATVIGFIALLSTSERPVASAAAPDTTTTATAPGQTHERENGPGASTGSVELIALAHNRDADRLTVEGIVRNPVNANQVSHLTAVVLLFNSAGTLVATERAPIDSSILERGAESRFAVSVPASNIVRYRVSFRTDEHIVPHVDKRNGL